ncbi:MAG TPA: DUF1127 domain-containing protein [Alphaproteobacteria bacterium]
MRIFPGTHMPLGWRHETNHAIPRALAGAVQRTGSLLKSGAIAAADSVTDWQERARARHELGRIDDRVLRDIGLTRLDIARETAKPFWRR